MARDSQWIVSVICTFTHTTSKYSYGQEEASVLQHAPVTASPPLQVYRWPGENRDAPLAASLAWPEPGLMGTGKASRANL